MSLKTLKVDTMCQTCQHHNRTVQFANRKFNFEFSSFLSVGRGLTTDWSLVTATAPEAPTRMKRVSLFVSRENECTNLLA